jgi:hypothetical protein
MIRAGGIVLACLLLVPAAAGTGSAPAPVALTASPSRLMLSGSRPAAIQLANTGDRPVVVDAQRAGFALDLRGRPRIVARSGPRVATSWLALRPRRLVLRPGATASLTVAARVPPHAAPGDHDALVLLTTRPQRAGGVAMRLRIGVVVVVRAPGRIVRRIELRRLRTLRLGKIRMLELLVVNRGNVGERLGRDRLALALFQRGRGVAKLRHSGRRLLPRTRGVVLFPYRGRLHGWMTARVALTLGAGETRQRSFRIRL